MLYQLAKQILNHRSGTLFEDMYWIDSNNLKIVAEETSALIEKEIVYSEVTKKIVASSSDLITIHSHPNSFPPSISDFNSNFSNRYLVGIVICHDGRVYMYKAMEEIPVDYFNLTVVVYLKHGYNENEAQILALDEIKDKFNILVKEVTGDDV